MRTFIAITISLALLIIAAFGIGFTRIEKQKQNRVKDKLIVEVQTTPSATEEKTFNLGKAFHDINIQITREGWSSRSEKTVQLKVQYDYLSILVTRWMQDNPDSTPADCTIPIYKDKDNYSVFPKECRFPVSRWAIGSKSMTPKIISEFVAYLQDPERTGANKLKWDYFNMANYEETVRQYAEVFYTIPGISPVEHINMLNFFVGLAFE